MGIKVLHTEWSDGWGGQEIRTVNEMIALRDKGIEVFLACKENSKINQKAQEQNIKVFTLPFSGNTDFKTLFGLMKIIKMFNIDIVNTHSGKDTWVGGLAAKFAGAKFIRTRHLSNKIRSSRLNFINELADFILTTGESVRSDMIKYNRIDPKKIMSVPTGIDDEVFDPILYNKSTCRDKFGFHSDEIVIGIVAVLRQFKRHDIFIDVANTIINKNLDKKIKFIIAGEGPQRNAIESLIKKLNLQDNIILLGHVDNVTELLSALDIFMLTSDSKEGVPQSVMQSLLMGKATIATDVGSTKDLYNSNNFILVDCDKDILAKELESLILSKDKQISLENNSRGYIKENFSKKSMVDKILKIYNKILEK